MAIRYLTQKEVESLAPVVVEDAVQSLETAVNDLLDVAEAVDNNESNNDEVLTDEVDVEEREVEEAPVVEAAPVKIQKEAFSGQHSNFKNNSKKGKR